MLALDGAELEVAEGGFDVVAEVGAVALQGVGLEYASGEPFVGVVGEDDLPGFGVDDAA